MRRRDFNRILGAAAVGPVLGLSPLGISAAGGSSTRAGASPAGSPATSGPGPLEPGRRWSLVADVAECCSCAIPCSCNFGRPEAGTCHGTRLIQIREGEMDGRNLAGVRFVVSFQMGVWTRIYADEALDADRSAALEAILPTAFGGFARVARARMRAPITVQEEPGLFRFSVPESTIEMRLLPGLGGEPIRIQSLPNPAYHEYVQYESVVHRHQSADATWSYSGTNGFRSVMRANG